MRSISKAMEKARRERHDGAVESISDSLPRCPVRPDRVLEPQEDKSYPLPVNEGRELERPGEDPLRFGEGDFGSPDEHLVSLISPDSIESEHYRTLRHSVERMGRNGGAAVIGVSSPSPKDGKTLTTLNLAGSLAQDSRARVLVIDADLRNPTVGSYLRMASTGSGLSGALARKTCTLESVVKSYPRYNLAILPTGSNQSAPYEAFKSPRMSAVIREARRLFDYVFVDMPPLIFPECRLLEALVDGILIVVSAHRTQRRALQEGLGSLDSSKILGFVFNRDTQHRTLIPSYYQRYYQNR